MPQPPWLIPEEVPLKMRHRIAAAAAIPLAAAAIGGWKWTHAARATSEYPVNVIVNTSNQVQEVGANPNDMLIDGWSWGEE